MRNQPNTSAAEIGNLAEFLNISVSDLDGMSEEEQDTLLKQLIAISQMKLTRLALRL